MNMSYYIKQELVQAFFFRKRSHFPGKRQTWNFSFSQSGKRSKHIQNTKNNLSRGSVAHCLKFFKA